MSPKRSLGFPTRAADIRTLRPFGAKGRIEVARILMGASNAGEVQMSPSVSNSPWSQDLPLHATGDN